MTRAVVYAGVSTAAKVMKATSERIADDDANRFEQRPEIHIEALITLAPSRPRRREHDPAALWKQGKAAAGSADASNRKSLGYRLGLTTHRLHMGASRG
jgi:hypothetical protein